MDRIEVMNVRISIVIVNFKVPHYVKQAILSLRDAELFEQTEIIVVDNASGDDSEKIVLDEFPEITWIGLKQNIGFGKACNVGTRNARGEYVLFLNPDTVVSRNTLSSCVRCIESNDRIGLIGPKILNPDGTMQASCRRSFPTPLVALYHFSGLSKLFPKSQHVGRYNMTYLDEDQLNRVDAVSGSFMFMRKGLFDQIGGFDEQFFMYGEDLDLCRQVYEKGYEVWYNPETQIIHYKGTSSAKRIFYSQLAFYQAMVLFSRKYSKSHEAFLPGWLVLIGIFIQAAIHIGKGLFKSLTAFLIDLLIINSTLWAAIYFRFKMGNQPIPYNNDATLWMMLGMHVLLSGSFVWSFAYRGIYTKGRYSAKNTFVSGLLATLIFMSSVFFIKAIAFSRISFAGASIITTLLLVGWREFLPRISESIKSVMYSTGKVIIIGKGAVAQKLVKDIEQDSSAKILGIIWPDEQEASPNFEGYPVLGTLKRLPRILRHGSVDLLLIATLEPWYSFVISALAYNKISKMTVRWVPQEILTNETAELPDVIPLENFSV